MKIHLSSGGRQKWLLQRDGDKGDKSFVSSQTLPEVTDPSDIVSSMS